MQHSKIFLLFLILSLSHTIFAQKPAWADYHKRQALYPESEYLVGFMSGVASVGDEISQLKLTYEALAKDKLVQLIQVEIQTNNSLNISNVNGQSEEAFLSKSVSVSKAQLNGLTIQSYYDRKKKEVFAIAFANRKELAFYYYNMIKSGREDVEQKLAEGRAYEKKRDKENALRSYYEAMPIISNIDESRALLIALNRKMYAQIHAEDINTLKVSIIESIENLQQAGDLNIGEVAYFAAYGLYLQLGEINMPMVIDRLEYETTGLESRFSKRWYQELTTALKKAGGYVIQKSHHPSSNTLVVGGNYWQEGSLLKINTMVRQGEELKAVAKASLRKDWLEQESLDYIPSALVKMEQLQPYALSLISKPDFIKMGQASLVPIQVQAFEVRSEKNTPVKNLSLVLQFSDEDTFLAHGKTDDNGMANVFIPAIERSDEVISFQLGVDLAEYLGISRDDAYWLTASRQNPVTPISIDMLSRRPTIYIQTEEMIQGKTLKIPIIEPALKNKLVEHGFHFVDKASEADFVIKIQGNTTTTSKAQGLAFAYLDVNMSLLDVSKDEEIFKTSVNQIKGGSSSIEKAAMKAYNMASDLLVEQLEASPLGQLTNH